MKNFWIILWIILLFCQIVTVLVSRQLVNELDLPPGDLDHELLDLAKQTNGVWFREGVLGRDRGDVKTASRNEDLMTRESLILELTRLESEIIAEGVDLEIIEDLQAYLKTLDGSESVITINAYISGMIDWLQPFMRSGGDCDLERVNLFPAKLAGFPVLVFEMSGTPETMGERLSECLEKNNRWSLDELDLLMAGADGPCWLRGSYSFMKSPKPDAR